MPVRDALVECLCPEIRLPDLGLHLFRGDTEWIESSKAMESLDLQHARRVRAVQVSWKVRCQVSKEAPAQTPPWLKRSIIRPVRHVATEPVVHHTSPEVRDLRSEVRDVIREEVRLALAGLPLSQPAPQSEETAPVVVNVSEGLTSELVAKAVAQALQAAGLGTKPVVDDGPVFIPSSIVSEDTTTAINVESSSSVSTLDDAAEALRAAKKGRKPKTKTEE
jgi:hypothetical protein